MEDPTSSPVPPTIAAQRHVLLDHFHLSVRVHGEGLASRMMRKFGIKFATHHPDAEQVAAAFIAVKSLEQWHAVLDCHYPEEPDAVRSDEVNPLAAPRKS